MKKFLQLKSLLAIVLLAVGVGVSYADTYSYTFDAQKYSASGESVALGEATWTLTTDAGYFGYDNQYGKGQQIGSSSKPAKTATLSTSQFADAEITSITINTSGASSVVADVAIKVGGAQLGETTAITKTATDYTFTGSGKGDVAIEWTNNSSKALYIKSITIEYTTASTSSVATPTFSVDPGTYGEKISVELECETDGATIYYTLDGNTPDNTSTLYEAAIELNSKTTVKAIAYVGEEASNVATATYDFKLEGSLSFVTAPIFASDMNGKIDWTADWANNTVNYLVTYDGTVPTVDNKANTGKGKTRNIPMFSWKKDTAVVVSIRPEKDGIYGDTFKRTYYIKYAKTLDAYKTVSEVAAGNYVLVGENSVMLPIDGEGKDYGYGYTVDATVNNGLVSAFGLFEFAFEAADGGYYIKDSKGQYLYAKGTYKSFNLSSTVPATGGVWSVEIQANGQAKISNNETGRWIQWDDYYKNWAMPDGDQGTFMPTLAAKHVPTLEMTPAANATVETLDKIVLTCSDGIASGSGMKYVSIQGKNVTATVTANQVDDNTLELVLSEPITTAGNYDFVFYKGCVTLGPGSLNQAYPAATQYITYTVGGGAEPIELVVTPANESVNKSLQHFTFSCEQGISINGLFGGQAPFLGFTDPATGNASQIALTPGVSTETSVTLSTEAAQTTEGYYTLVVPAEYFVLAEAQPNEAIMYQYIVSATNPNAINIKSVTPEEGNVTELKQIIVMCDVEIDMAPSTWTITDAKGNVYPAQYTSPANLGFMGIQIDLKEAITAEGTYTLNIPAGSIVEYLGSKQIEEQTITWTIGGTVETPDYIFNADDYEVDAEFTTLTDGIFTFVQGQGTTKTWKVDKSEKTYSNGVSTTNRIKPQSNKNYITADVPAAGKLVIAVHCANEDADRTLSVKQNDVELYGKIVSNATDKVDEVYSVHEVAVEAGLATITMPVNTLNFSYIEFVPAGDAPATIEFLSVNPEEGVVTSLKNIQVITDTDLGEANDLTLTDADGKEYSLNAVTNDRVGEDGIYESIIITLSEEITAAGTYTLTIPAGKVVEYITDMETQTPKLNAEKTYTWTIEGEQELKIKSITPADGDAVESFSEMTVVVNKEIFFDSFNGRTPSLLNAAGESVANMGVDFPGFTGVHQTDMGGLMLGKTFVLYCMSPITEPGNYQVVFYPNSFKTDDETESLPEFTVNFTIGTPAPAITATWSMEEGAVVESFESINITFAGEGIESAKAVGTYTNFIFYEKDAEGNYNHTASNCTAGYMDTQASGTTVTFSLAPDCYSSDMVSPFNRKGEYRIVIPAGAIMFNGDKNNVNTEEYVLNFTIENDIVVPEEVEAAYTANPENNSTIKELKEVVITFTEYAEIVVCEPDFVMGSNIPVVSMTDPEFGMTMPAGYMMARAGSAANELVLYVDPMYTGGMESYAVAGAYTVTIPAGVVKFGNNINKAFTLSYTVEGVEQGLTVTASDPADGATVNKLESIVVDWSLAITVADASNLEATIQNVHGNVVSTLRGVFSGLAGNQIRYVLNTPVTENGIYTLVIPEGDVMDFDTETIFNAETTLTFTVDAPATGAPVMVESDPANGATVDAIESFTIVFNKPVVYDNYFEQASLQDKGGKVIANVKSAEYKDGDEETGSTTITFNLDNKVVEANTFVFVVPAKTIIDTYDWMTMMEKDINIEVTIAGSGVEDVIVVGSTPAANSIVQELSEITVEFNTGAAVLYMPNVVDESGKVLSATTSSYTDADGNTLADNVARFILTTPITNQGTVYLVIEAGSVYDYPNYAVSNSQEYRIKIEVTGAGINGIVADPVNGYVVYDLNGYRVMQTKKASDLERLNNGIYIINGVKVLLNK